MCNIAFILLGVVIVFFILRFFKKRNCNRICEGDLGMNDSSGRWKCGRCKLSEKPSCENGVTCTQRGEWECLDEGKQPEATMSMKMDVSWAGMEGRILPISICTLSCGECTDSQKRIPILINSSAVSGIYDPQTGFEIANNKEYPFAVPSLHDGTAFETPPYFTTFSWDAEMNPNPKVAMDVFFHSMITAAGLSDNAMWCLYIVMFDTETYDSMGYAKIYEGTVRDVSSLIQSNSKICITESPASPIRFLKKYITDIQNKPKRNVGFSLMYHSSSSSLSNSDDDSDDDINSTLQYFFTSYPGSPPINFVITT